MSETTWSPGGVVEGVEPDEGGGRDRRRVVLFGGLALAALASTGALLMTGSDETVLEAAPPPAPAASAPTASPSPALSVVPQAVPARSGRDPFLDPAAPPAVAAQPVGAEGDTSPTGEQAVPAVPAVPVAPTTPPVAPVPPGGTPATTDPAEPATSLSLLRVATSGQARTAVFRVGDEQVTAGIGDSFGGAAGLLLLSLQEGPERGQWTAVVQAGLGDPFDVVTGTPVPLT